jgi:hypothetical protein
MQSNQPRVVGLNDLGQLTVRANVAFAVRCAQRIRPCFQLPENHPRRREHMAAIDSAIGVAAAFCQGQALDPGRAAAAAELAEAIAEATYQTTNYAAFGAVRAAEAAAHAEAWVRNPSSSEAIQIVAAAFGAARVLAANADMFSHNTVADALYADMEKLQTLGPGACEELGPPIDPTEEGPLGPLWPAGVPLCFRG